MEKTCIKTNVHGDSNLYLKYKDFRKKLRKIIKLAKIKVKEQKQCKAVYDSAVYAQDSLVLRAESLQNTNLSRNHNKVKISKIKADNLGVKVKFLGLVPNNKIAETYNSYVVYVICSLYEGNPKTLLEAMACGCAVIGTDVPGIRSIISHKKNGLLADNSPLLLKKCILNILSDNKLKNTLVENAIEYIKTNNSLENAITKEFYAYSECLK